VLDDALILPWLRRIKPVLTPLAASGLASVSIDAAGKAIR
jgi:hypothetical protein